MVREKPLPSDDEGDSGAPRAAAAPRGVTLAEAKQALPAKPATRAQKGKATRSAKKAPADVTPPPLAVLPGVYDAAELEEV